MSFAAFGRGLSLAACIASFGCAGSKVKAHAANEFKCTAAKLKVLDLDNGSYRVEGCGQTADYFCNGAMCVAANEPVADAPTAKPNEKPDPPGTKKFKKGNVSFKLPDGFKKDEADPEAYSDADQHHIVKVKVQPFAGEEDAYLDTNFVEAKRWTEAFGAVEVHYATKMDAGGTRRMSAGVLTKDGKAYELSCSFDDAASTKTDAVCLRILRSMRVAKEAAPTAEQPDE
jgi:hypothetical protein